MKTENNLITHPKPAPDKPVALLNSNISDTFRIENDWQEPNINNNNKKCILLFCFFLV